MDIKKKSMNRSGGSVVVKYKKYILKIDYSFTRHVKLFKGEFFHHTHLFHILLIY